MGQVVLKGINKFYESVHAVKDVNLQIRDKEFVVFVGPSGCGKTTTLRMIAGLEAISSGDISIDGNVINALAPMDRDIAMVFQNYALYPHMSVYDNMAFGLKMRKFERPEIEKRVREAADILGIGELLKRKPRQLSGGQRQRRHPRVFLFDEPLSNLDAKLRVQMRVELKKLHLRLGTTAIYVTHDQVEAMTLGDRVVVMKDGVVQQVGEPLELYNQPANKFVAGFIGSPAMNFAAVTVTEADASLIAENSGLRIKLPDEIAQRLRGHIGREVILGVRPEDLTVAGSADLRCCDRGGRATRLGNPARYEGRREYHGGERRADREGEGGRQAARCHAAFQASRFRRADRGGHLMPAVGHFSTGEGEFAQNR
jgi:multiple sugar transport system ATP-binding protein